MVDTILYDSAMRLFAAEVTPAGLEDVEQGLWPDALWQAVDEAGYLDVLIDGIDNMVEAATILRAAGHHAAPIPLVETMLARFLCAAVQLPAPDGALTIAPVEPGARLVIGGGAVSGRAGHVPWGLASRAIVAVGEGELAVVWGGALSWDAADNLAYESRDHLSAAGARGDIRALPEGIDAALVLRLGALMRAAQMAGAMEAALALATQYANERVQFGRPIGKFQAIQQQMAVLAEHAASSWVAVENAARAVAAGRPSAEFACAAAKIRAGEAAGNVAEIAHQVHGAIGFTKEYGLHKLTRRLWSWRDEYGNESYWARELGRRIAEAGGDGLWPLITAP
jgi:alkylation response protein AidB-like acyl-CoA dehydrogenase